MSKYSFILFPFFLIGLQLSISAQNEIFIGKLTYEVEDHEGISNQPLDIQLILVPVDVTEVLINDDFLIHKSYSKKLGVSSAGYQNKDTAYLYGENGGKIDFSVIPGNLGEISLVKKTKETKEILGLSCRKYVYLSDGNIFIVWIPKKKLYASQRSYGRFFDYFFYPDGLGFEITMATPEVPYRKLITKRLIKMELFLPTKEDIENFKKGIE